jgi:hypothetical protein
MKLKIASTRPFDNRALGVYCEQPPIRDSFKFTSTASGVLSTSAAMGVEGFGYIVVAPTGTNDGLAFYHSNGGSTNFIDCTTGTSGTMSSPFTSVSMTDGSHARQNGVVCRIISCGLRIRYVGTAEDAGGRVYGYTSPTKQNINYMTLKQMAVAPETVKFTTPCSGEWLELVAVAQTDDELDYPQEHTGDDNANKNWVALTYPWSKDKRISTAAGWESKGAAPLGFQIAAATSGVDFEYEIICHCEAVGSTVHQMVTANHFSPTSNGQRESQAAHREGAQKQAQTGSSACCC